MTLNQKQPPINIQEEVRDNTLITCTKVENVLRNKKAAGPDRIYYEHLKEAKDAIIEPLTELYNKCLDAGTIREIWRKS